MAKVFVSELSVSIVVVADSIEEAEEKILSEEFFYKEINNNGIDFDNINTYPVEDVSYIPHNWDDAVPYGGTDKTVAELLDEQ